jgi:hypothetical protein
MAAPSLRLNVIDHPYLELTVPSDWTRLPEQDGLFAAFERADHAMLSIVLGAGASAPSPRAFLDEVMAVHVAALARNHPQQMEPQPVLRRTANGLCEATRQYLCRRDGGPPWRVTARYATTVMPVSVRGLPLGYPLVQLTVYETPWAGPELANLLAGARIVPSAAMLAAVTGPATRWAWISLPGGERMLAYTYDDPVAGPSAKGGAVSSAPTNAELRAAIEHPDRTVRDPDAFGAIVVGAEEALRLGLPKDPPWLAVFEGRAPARRAEATRHVTVFVRRAGELVRGAKVTLGGEELVADATGRCDFMHAPAYALGAIAVLGDETSERVEVPPGARSIVLEMSPRRA